MMKLYGSPKTRAIRVLWTLEEIGCGYDYVKVDLLRGEGFRPPYIHVNPSGKVPTLVDGGLTLSESAAICTYLAEKFPVAGLIPAAGTPPRALYHQWCCFVISELEQPLWTMAKHRFALPKDWRVPAVLDTAAKEFAIAAGLLDAALADRPYILGENFTAADILIAHTLAWARDFGQPLGHDRLDAYAARALGRPALARAVARSQGG